MFNVKLRIKKHFSTFWLTQINQNPEIRLEKFHCLLPWTSPPAWSSWRWWRSSAPRSSSRIRQKSPAETLGWRCRRSASCSHRCSWSWCSHFQGCLKWDKGNGCPLFFWNLKAANESFNYTPKFQVHAGSDQSKCSVFPRTFKTFDMEDWLSLYPSTWLYLMKRNTIKKALQL